MKISIIVLDKNKKHEAYMSRQDYFDKYSVYDATGSFKSLAKGAPNLITIDGATYLVDKLPVLTNKRTFDDFCRELRYPTSINSSDRIVFIWR